MQNKNYLSPLKTIMANKSYGKDFPVPNIKKKPPNSLPSLLANSNYKGCHVNKSWKIIAYLAI
jgi:hypothetical protein